MSEGIGLHVGLQLDLIHQQTFVLKGVKSTSTHFTFRPLTSLQNSNFREGVQGRSQAILNRARGGGVSRPHTSTTSLFVCLFQSLFKKTAPKKDTSFVTFPENCYKVEIFVDKYLKVKRPEITNFTPKQQRLRPIKS